MRAQRDIGMFAWFGYPGPMDDRLSMIADAGFAATCLWHWSAERAADVEHWPGWARDRGLRVDNVHSPHSGCNGLWRADERGEQILRRYSDTIDYARRHGIPKVVIHVTGGPGPKQLGETGFEQIGRLVEQAASAGVVLAVENTRRRDAIDALLERFDTPAVGFCYDSSHDFLHGRPVGDVLTRWGGRLATTHFADNHGQRDDHLLPFLGTGDFNAVAAAFPARYDGPVMLEALAGPGAAEDPADFLHDAYASAQRLAGRLP